MIFFAALVVLMVLTLPSPDAEARAWEDAADRAEAEGMPYIAREFRRHAERLRGTTRRQENHR